MLRFRCFFLLMLFLTQGYVFSFSSNDLKFKAEIKIPDRGGDPEINDLLRIIKRLEWEKEELRKERDTINSLFGGLTSFIDENKEGSK